MPVTIVKPKPKVQAAKPVVKNDVEVLGADKLTLEDLVDHYGRLQDEIMALEANPVFAHFKLVDEELKKRLAENYEPDEIVKVTAKHWLLEAGACSKEPRKVLDPLKVMKMLGTETFAKIAKINVSDAEKYLNPDQCAEVLSESGFTKNRKIKVAYLGK